MRVAGGGRPPGGGPPTACPPGALNQPASQVAERGGVLPRGTGVLLFIGSVCVLGEGGTHPGIREILDHATFREKVRAMSWLDKLLSLALCNWVNFDISCSFQSRRVFFKSE